MEEKFLKLTNAVYKLLEYFPESDPLKNRAKDKALLIMENLSSLKETSDWTSFQDLIGSRKIRVTLLEDIDILLGYLWIGKTQEWLNSVNYFIIVNEYEKVKKSIGLITDQNKLENKVPKIEQKLPKIYNPVISEVEAKDEPPVSVYQEDVENMVEEEQQADEFLPNKVVNQKIELSDRQRKIIEYLNKNEKAQVMGLQTVLPNITKRTIRRDLDELLGLGRITRLGDFNQVFYKIK